MLLRHRGTMTAAELAAELEVSTRTVLRDIDALSTSGVPVYTDRGHGGGIRLLPGYRTDLTGLTLDEATALLAGTSVSPAFASAMRKVAAALPDAHRRQAAAAAQRIHVRPDGFTRPAVDEPFLGALQQAAIDGLRVRAMYQARGAKPTERVLDPIGLVHAGGTWYLLALRDGERRTYRTSRFSAVTVLDEAAVRDNTVDLATEFEQSRNSFRQNHSALIVTVRTDDDGWAQFRRFTPIVTSPDENGVGQVEFRDHRHAMMTLWPAVTQVQILSPETLRDDINDKLQRAVAVQSEERVSRE